VWCAVCFCAVESFGLAKDVVSADCREGLLVLFYSKNLMIPPAYLRDAEIPVYEVTLSAGQVLVAHGNWIHCGLNVTPYSIGAAVNFEDETGMCENPVVVTEMCQFIAKHHPKVNPEAKAWLEEWKRVYLSLPPGTPSFYVAPAIWDLVMHNVPYYWTCSRLRGQKLDIWKQVYGTKASDVVWVEGVRQRKLLYVAMQEEEEATMPESEKQANFEGEADALDFRWTPYFPYTKSDAELVAAMQRIEGQYTCASHLCASLPVRPLHVARST
jgi:hypothetical protein